MNKKYIVLSFLLILTLTILAGVGTLLVNNRSKKQTQNNVSVPAEIQKRLDENQSRILFSPKLITEKISNENLEDINFGKDDKEAKDYDSVTLVYKAGDTNYYDLYQTTKSYELPAGKTIKIKNGIEGTYYVCEKDCVNNDKSPKGTIYWKENAINYTLIHYVDLTNDQLIKLASSLK